MNDISTIEKSTLDYLKEGFQLIGFDWRYLYVNNAFVEQSKMKSKKDLLGFTMMEKFPGIEKKAWFKIILECMTLRISKTIEIDYSFEENTKEYFELKIEPVPKGIVILSVDITEKKKSAQELKESIEFSRGILNSIDSCIAVVTKTGKIIKTNQAWNILSASAEMSEANFIGEGKNFLHILDKAADNGNVIAKDTILGFRQVMNDKISIYQNQYYFKPTGFNNKLWFNIVISAFQSQSDMVIINIQNITNLKNTEKERDLTQEANIKLHKIELELSNALAIEKDMNELKSRFLSMASHEFRTPLTTIMTSLSLISKYAENKDTDSQLKHIDKIKVSVNNLTDILNDFLSISRLKEDKIENDPNEINLKIMIGDIISEMQSTVTDGIKIIEQYHAKKMVIVDQKLLKNILFNLLSNAIKFSKANSVIEVIVEELEDTIVISLKDNGIGISKADQMYLFQKFFRGYNAQHIQGTGLGLYIIAKHAALMNATLTYESIENKGSIFSLTIPQKTI